VFQTTLPAPPPQDPSFKVWAGLVISLIALMQPWVIGLWKKLFRRGDIDIHPTAAIELGYSGFGPTIALTGTLRALHRDQFVESMQLIVTKIRDGSRHTFDWLVFRAGKLSTARSEITAELASGFMLPIAQPRSYNVLFQDAATHADLRTHTDSAKRAWLLFVSESESTKGAATLALVAADQVRLAGLFTDFAKKQVATEAYGEIDHMVYWEAGEYELELVVNTTRPDVAISEAWRFKLTLDDVKNLRLNAVVILREVCDQAVTYNFAYPAYEPLPGAE
jgi:hypothetical protein